MFNDKYGLTQAVLDGRKTMTRRIVPQRMIDVYEDWLDEAMTIALPPGTRFMSITYYLLKHTSYCIGEMVAIAQSYKDIAEPQDEAQNVLGLYKVSDRLLSMEEMGAGWNNKLFVKSSLMLHHIRITNVKIEHLQDISDDDCMREAVYPYYYGDIEEKKHYGIPPNGYSFDGIDCHYPTPRKAFASLIDKVSGKGVWKSNPWVFAYEFKLID